MSKKRFDNIPFGGKFDININCGSFDTLTGKVLKCPSTKISTGYKINKVIYNGVATIVFWDDGTKTIAKYNDEGADLYSEFTGLLVAVMKKLVAPSQLRQLFDDWLPEVYQSEVTISDVRKRHKIIDNKESDSKKSEAKDFENE